MSSIDEWFHEYVFKWMFRDIDSAIKNQENYLAALGIAVYSEALIRHKYPDMSSSCLYEVFLTYLGDEYVKVDKKMKNNGKKGLYNVVRCGLAHEYTIKTNSIIFQDAKITINCGIIYDAKTDCTIIILKKYFEDFKRAACQIHQELSSSIKTGKISVLGGLTNTSGDFLIDPKYINTKKEEEEVVLLDGEFIEPKEKK